MTEEIPFGKSLAKNMSLIMLECSTRRSIISTVAYVRKHGLKEYNNKRWTVRYLGTKNYQVVDNVTKTEYFVVDHYDGWMGYSGFSVYKKEAENK